MSDSDFHSNSCYEGGCADCDGYREPAWVAERLGRKRAKCLHYCHDKGRGRGQGSRVGDTDYG